MKKPSTDQRSTQEITQAIKDDQALSVVAGDIQVTVKDGTVTLDGEVATEQQMNLAVNTAAAVGVVDKVKNHIELTPHKPANDMARADDDGFTVRTVRPNS